MWLSGPETTLGTYTVISDTKSKSKKFTSTFCAHTLVCQPGPYSRRWSRIQSEMGQSEKEIHNVDFTSSRKAIFPSTLSRRKAWAKRCICMAYLNEAILIDMGWLESFFLWLETAIDKAGTALGCEWPWKLCQRIQMKFYRIRWYLCSWGLSFFLHFREMTLGEVQGACWHRRMCCDLLFWDFSPGRKWEINNAESCKCHIRGSCSTLQSGSLPFLLSLDPCYNKCRWMCRDAKQHGMYWMDGHLVFNCLPEPKTVNCGF